MARSFDFSSSLLEAGTFLSLADLSKGSGWGIDNANRFSAVAASQSIEAAFDVDVFAIALREGQSYRFDGDRARGDSQFIDVQLDVIDFRGNLVRTDDDGARDDRGANDDFLFDPNLNFTPDKSGIYFVAVRHFANDYVDGGHAWERVSATTGDYALNVSTSSLPSLTTLSGASQERDYSDKAQRVLAGGGNDELDMNGGADVVDGQGGRDRLRGGTGDDQVTGGSGNDDLGGGSGDDVIRGSSGEDRANGNGGDDDIIGGGGDDTLSGGGGDDVIWGSGGDDVISGGGGRDFLRGGEGVDRMTGGDGDDTFHFRDADEAPPAFGEQVDRIEGFEGGDLIDLTDVIAGALTFIGEAAFTAADQVRLVDFGGGLQKVQVNLDAGLTDSELDVLVDVSEVGNLAFGDFALA